MEKRKFSRIDYTIQVWYQTFDEDDISFGRPQTKNLSAGGVLLSMTDREEVGSSIIMKFKLPDYDERILTRAQIVRVDKVASEDFDIGVKFLNIREKDKEAIQELVFSEN